MDRPNTGGDTGRIQTRDHERSTLQGLEPSPPGHTRIIDSIFNVASKFRGHQCGTRNRYSQESTQSRN
ncbi:hypothetical protein A2U01_0063765 [Trifolium medium]|uniref:Uncharacterized protein n=1 Tax=Trifolium medium TaxID=97028 RepID=A0A392S0Z8_9FABA|nr:hypothetical protein [Trifolium medium]